MVISCRINNYPQLNKRFKIIIFDWDGTAVVDRKSDASNVVKAAEELLKKGVIVVVITGTNFENIDKQFSSNIKDNCKTNLFICTNRGSEVYSFDKSSKPILLHKRTATKQENKLLDKITERTRELIESTSNLKTEIIYNRLNRRKLDLIPEWADPPKYEIENLLKTTENKLEKNGFPGGIRKAYLLMIDIAKSSGMVSAKITSDVKHLEIGLTSKADSINWVNANLIDKFNIPDNEVLIGGDEFGDIGGLPGSDSLMIIKKKPEITYFSVGIEPNGVPQAVIYLGGGPECFVEVLNHQLKYQE